MFNGLGIMRKSSVRSLQWANRKRETEDVAKIQKSICLSRLLHNQKKFISKDPECFRDAQSLTFASFKFLPTVEMTPLQHPAQVDKLQSR